MRIWYEPLHISIVLLSFAQLFFQTWWVEHFRHFRLLWWLWLLRSLGRWRFDGLEPRLRLGVKESNSTLEDLAWVLKVELLVINWFPDRGAQLLRLSDPVPDHFWRVYQVHQVILIFVLNCQVLSASAIKVDPSEARRVHLGWCR